MKQLRKILPCTLDNGQYDAYYALKAKDDLLKINVTARGSTTVTILIPLYKEIAKFQYSYWTTLKDSKTVLQSIYKVFNRWNPNKRFTDTPS